MNEMRRPEQFPYARQSAGVSPLRRENSIRRTTTIESTWPDGPSEPWIMLGRARDVYTAAADSAPSVLATGEFHIKSSLKREILEISVVPDDPRAQQLVNIRAGSASRETLKALLGDRQGTPLFQLLDDFAGASLVARWVWRFHIHDWHTATHAGGSEKLRGRNGSMVDICTGFARGSAAMDEAGNPNTDIQSVTPVGPLQNPEDPDGWHEFTAAGPGPQMRRARRIDLWKDGDLIRVDAAFQDSGNQSDGNRIAVHEYRVHAEIDRFSGKLVALQALPLILPFAECPAASIRATRLIGQQVGELRQTVPVELAGPAGCTHLNDVLRGLADVPELARQLPV